MNLNTRFSVNLIVLLLVNIFRVISGQNIPSSPCSNIFQYHHNGDEWGAIIHLDRIQSTITNLEAKLVVDTILPSNYVGEIKISGANQQFNQPATYLVKFPVQNPLPTLLEITVNNIVICRGRASNAKRKTNITLRNKLQLTCEGCETEIYQPVQRVPSSNNFNSIQNVIENVPQRAPKPQNTRPISSAQDVDQVCGQPVHTSVALVTRGETIAPGAWPWLVGLFTKNDYKFQCGGTLVSSKTVITSAHCYRLQEINLSSNDVLIAIGRHHINRRSEGEISFVNQIIVHPDWNAYGVSHDADIAITILQQRIEFTSTIIPACLWPSSDKMPSKRPTLVGWGKDETGNLSEVPQKITTKIVSDAKCLRSNEIFLQITSDRTFCVGEKNGQSPCGGDSGSGLLVMHNSRWYLRGIVGGAANDFKIGCDAYDYSVFADVSKFRNFIRSNIVY